MAIDNNNPLEQQNNPEPNGSNSEASTRRRTKPRRDGKGSNSQSNKTSKTSLSKNKTRRDGNDASQDSHAVATQAMDPNLNNSDIGDAENNAAAEPEGGSKAIGDQRIT